MRFQKQFCSSEYKGSLDQHQKNQVFIWFQLLSHLYEYYFGCNTAVFTLVLIENHILKYESAITIWHYSWIVSILFTFPHLFMAERYFSCTCIHKITIIFICIGYSFSIYLSIIKQRNQKNPSSSNHKGFARIQLTYISSNDYHFIYFS